MSKQSHQTAKLGRGKHASPEDGVCVMELASMLAGEPFGDQPRAVCPVIGAVLRPYNDSVDDTRRQDLYAYAAKIVSTRGDRKTTRLRARTALRFFADEAPGGRSTELSRFSRRFAGWRLPLVARACARYAMRTDESSHAQLLSLVDRLIALGGTDPDAVAALVAPPREPVTTYPH